MADIKHSQIEISVNSELISEIRSLIAYKSAADEAMSYCLETTNDEHAKHLLLTALNIGAHGNSAEQPLAPDAAKWSGHYETCPAKNGGTCMCGY